MDLRGTGAWQQKKEMLLTCGGCSTPTGCRTVGECTYRKKELEREAKKDDQDKVPLHLVTPSYIRGTAEVLGFGAKKYAEWNWTKGLDVSRTYRAALGHLMAWYEGEDLDPESGLAHLKHASCNLMFLLWTLENRPDKDDRPQLTVHAPRADGTEDTEDDT